MVSISNGWEPVQHPELLLLLFVDISGDFTDNCENREFDLLREALEGS